MKNRALKIIMIVLIIFMSVLCLNNTMSVKADSGWDTDYDSGSSWDSDSSWDNDYDSGSSSDSNYSGGSGGSSSRCTTEECKKNRRISAIVGLISISVIAISAFLYAFLKANTKGKIKIIREIVSFIVVIGGMYIGIILALRNGPISLVLMPISVILGTILNPNTGSRSRREYPQTIPTDSIYNYEQITSGEANSIIPDFNIEEFNFKAYQIFYDTQMAWMEFDYDKLKEILTDELYNTYEMDLEVLKTKNQKNIMKEFKLNQVKLIDLNDINETYIAKVVLEVEFIDYIEDINNHKVIRGNDKHKVCNTYILTFERSKETKKDNICPKCGAKVEGNVTGICEYCKSKLINDNYDWIMSKKEKISQKKKL